VDFFYHQSRRPGWPISWSTYFTAFFSPTLLGNIVGGVALVAALGHAQVVGGKD
jgi:formate/nitrite transporter FocA (FNT family)